MKKRYLVYFFVAVLTAVGCGKKEGVVPSECKIDQVVASEERYQENELFYSTPEYVSEQWTWDDDAVIRIDYYLDNQYSEYFFYKRNRIICTRVPAYDLRTEFQYDGRRLEKVEVYRKDELAATMSFERDDRVMSEIVFRRIEADSNAEWPLWTPMPLRTVVGNDAAKAIGLDVAKQMQCGHSTAKSGNEVRYKLTWDNGNVVRIDVSGNVENPYSISLSYDNKKNPYEQLYANHELNESIFGFKMLSEHNVTHIHMPYQNWGVTDFRYGYTYEGDYPLTRKLIFNYRTQSISFDSVTIRVEKTEKYVYKKEL